MYITVFVTLFLIVCQKIILNPPGSRNGLTLSLPADMVKLHVLVCQQKIISRVPSSCRRMPVLPDTVCKGGAAILKVRGTKHDSRAERAKKFFCTPTFPNVGGTSKQMSVLNTLKFAVWLSHYSGGSRHLHLSPQRMAQNQNFYI